MTDDTPKILLVDLDPDSVQALTRLNGINALVGSFGRPYTVPRGSGSCVIDYQGIKLIDYKEAEGFVIDLHPLKAKPGDNVQPPPDNVKEVFGSGRGGTVDPRPYMMAFVRADLDRILDHGGIFVVFARPLEELRYVEGYLENGGRSLVRIAEPVTETNYSFLSEIRWNLGVNSDHGKEMSATSVDTPLGKLVSKHLNGGCFRCTLNDYTNWKSWHPLAISKFGACVAAYRVFDGAGGIVILLPEVSDQQGFLTALFRDVLPELRPKLFPKLQRGTWALTPPYEVDAVLSLQSRAKEVRALADKELATIETEIAKERLDHAFLFDLLRETGTSLVSAVKLALGALGFKDVLDVDEKMKAEEANPDLREDLQIHDRSPLLTVDVKGLGNFPTDSDALQAHKHASIRIQELSRFDIRALAIINHQRSVPPLERDNEMPFRAELLKVANQVKMGMLTTWDLHRLVRNARKLGWQPKHVMPVLYRIGRIEPIPEHYALIGQVEHFYEKPQVASIRLTNGALRRADKVAFEFPVEFHELEVKSVQVDRASVDEAPVGALCGIATPFQRKELKLGTRVYLVKT